MASVSHQASNPLSHSAYSRPDKPVHWMRATVAELKKLFLNLHPQESPLKVTICFQTLNMKKCAGCFIQATMFTADATIEPKAMCAQDCLHQRTMSVAGDHNSAFNQSSAVKFSSRALPTDSFKSKVCFKVVECHCIQYQKGPKRT